MDVHPAARGLTLAIAIDRAHKRHLNHARTRAAFNHGHEAKKLAYSRTVLRRSALTINAADRFGRARALLLDRVRLWSDEAAAECELVEAQNLARACMLPPALILMPTWILVLACGLAIACICCRN